MAGTVCRSLWKGSSLHLSPNLPLFSCTKVPISTFPVLRTAQDKAVSTEGEQSSESTQQQDKKMSSAMRVYLQRKREHDIFIARENAEFDIGTQHLASMMGIDHEAMTQEDIDKSIEYLFPSGLIPAARPTMQPPDKIYPRRKDAEFDAQGRPFQSFFFTTKPELQNRIYKLRESMEAVTIFGNRLAKQDKGPDPNQVLSLASLADSRWINLAELEDLTLEKVSENDLKELINVLERLIQLPFSYRVRDEIFQYRVSDGISVSKMEVIDPVYDERGRAVVEYKGRRKTSHATVRVSKPGTGEVTIRHADTPDYLMDLTYFFSLKERMQILYPLQFTKLLGLVDLDITVSGGGPSGQAGAVRYALSMCLRSYVERTMVDDMKINGLLTQDIRVSERKKPGKPGARKSPVWKRR